MDIREQIEQLRTQAGISGYHSLMAPAANTMEKLLAVYEAAEKYFVATMGGKVAPERAALSDALDEMNVYCAQIKSGSLK